MSARTVWERSLGRALVLLVVGLAALLALLVAPAADAATIIRVTTLADPGSGECEATGECSLREALERVASGKAGGDVEVVIQPQGEIELDGNELEVMGGVGLESIAIVGPGAAQLSVDAGGKSRVFRATAVDLKVTGLTIEGGHVDDAAIDGTGGAGIYSEDGSVLLEDVRVTGNEVESFRDGGGVAIEEEAQLAVIDSRIDHNVSGHYGGGLFTDSFAPVTITGSEIDHNEAGRGGGGIDSRGESLRVTESSISWNTAGEAGGGLYAQLPGKLERSTVNGNAAAESDGGGGLAMDSEADTFSVATATIAGNSGGGIRLQSGEVAVENSTVAANTTETREGAGVEGNDFRIRNSILAGNVQAGSEADCSAKVASEGGNILGAAAAASGCEWQPGSGDAFETDPQLAPLAQNGGPTFTMAPSSRESPAINHGVTAAALDQRGLVRPVPENLYDVGAVEVQAPRNLPGHEPTITAPSEAVVGDTISCEAGEWDTDTVTDASFALTWVVGNEAIDSDETHVLTNADAGRQLECEVDVDNGATTGVASSQPFELAPAVAELSPTALDLGSRRVGSGPGNAATLTVSNGGGADLEIDAVTSSDEAQFPLDASACLGEPVAPGDSCEVEVSFAPATVGPLSAELTVETNAPPSSVEASGTGTEPKFAAAPTSFDFGGRAVASGPSAPASFTVSNAGTASLAIGTMKLAGADAVQFQLGADGCSGATLEPGESCELSAAFSPAKTGALSATIEVPGEAPGTIALAGTGTEARISLTPSAHDFGAAQLGTTASPAQTFVAINTGTASAELGKATIAGAGAGSFAIAAASDGCSGSALAPGASCTVAVSFSPLATGALTATLQLPGAGADASSALSGTGTPAPSPPEPPGPSEPAAPAPGGPAVPAPPAAAPPEAVLLTDHGPHRVLDGRRIAVGLRCESALSACRIRLQLLRDGRLVGRWDGRLAAGTRRTVELVLTRRGRQELSRRPRLQATLRIATTGGPGETARLTYSEKSPIRPTSSSGKNSSEGLNGSPVSG